MSDKLYTRSEVSNHDQENDIWVIHEDKVLDVTAFIRDHPGGEEVILEYAGQDLTQAFEDIGHSEKALEMMSTFLVGKVDKKVENEEKTRTKIVDVKSPGAKAGESSPAQNLILPLLIVVLAIIAYYFYA